MLDPTPITPAATKPRRRPVIRALRFAACVVLVLAIAYGALCAWYYSQEVKPTRNIAAELNAPILKIPEEQRAWPHYRRALEVLEPRQNGEWSDGINDKNWSATAAYLKRNAHAIEMIRAASKIRPLGLLVQDGLDPVDIKWRARHRDLDEDKVSTTPPPSENPDIMGIAFTHLGVLMDITNVLRHDTLLAAQENDAPRVVANIEAILDLAEQLFEPPFLATELVATTIHGLGVDHLARQLAESPQSFSAADLSRIATRISGHLDRQDLGIRFTGEQAYVDDLIQRHFTDDGQGNGWFSIDGYPEDNAKAHEPEPTTWKARWDRFRVPLWAVFVIPRRAEVQRQSDEYFAAAAEHIKLSAWDDRADAFVDEQPAYVALRDWNPEYRNVLGHFHTARKINAEIRQHLGANCIAIALVLFHRQHDRWPTKLAEVPTELLPKTPLDQFNGQPLRYKLQDAAPLIYSVGPDRDDDNGTPPGLIDGDTQNLFHTDEQPDGDQILWPPKQPEPGEEVDEVEDAEMDAPDEERVDAETKMDADETIR